MRYSVYHYKPSGMEWVGDIPKHWKVHRLKHVASVQFSSVDKHTIEGEEPVRLCNYVDVYYNDFIKEGLEFMSATATRSEIARFQLRHGDVLVTKDSESWDDIAVPAYVSEELDGVLCGYHLAHIRPDLRKLIGEYLFRAFRSCGINDQFRVAANGITRFGLGKYWLDNGLFPVPPLEEQQAIASFLDRETAQIDTLIEKKQRQIELLQEKRSALISHAVTKGLYPNVKMKDSRIEWLGEIPEHWEVKRLKRFARLRSGESITAYEIDETGDYPVYGGNGLRGFTNSYTHNGAFVLIGRQGALCGCINYAAGYFWASEHAVVVSTKNNISTKWLGELLRSMNLNQYSQSAAQPGLAVETIAALFLPVPPPAEQCDIADFIDCETDKIDSMIRKVDNSITLLREYRIALISAAVTGKIDVCTVPAVRQEEVS